MRLFFLLCFVIHGWAADYDIAVIGSSPISLFEALYHHSSGKKVAIFEQAPECGGAWKAIDVCGISHVDLGCHQIGSDKKMKEFLEIYAGCKIVDMDDPFAESEGKNKHGNGFYFSKGCFELIDHLVQMIEKVGIDLFLNTKVKEVECASEGIVLTTDNRSVEVEKILCTTATLFQIKGQNNFQHQTKYHHLYLRVIDPEPPQFSYQYYGANGFSRIMNLTHFVHLTGTGEHLIVAQSNMPIQPTVEAELLQGLKNRNLLSPSASILQSEIHLFEQGHGCNTAINRLDPASKKRVEILSTGSFAGMSAYFAKWREVLIPYQELMDK